MQNFGWGGAWGFSAPSLFFPFFALLMLWSLFWKGLALWHASKRDDTWWFIALLVLNTAGILEIIYLFAYAKMKWEALFKTGTHH